MAALRRQLAKNTNNTKHITNSSNVVEYKSQEPLAKDQLWNDTSLETHSYVQNQPAEDDFLESPQISESFQSPSTLEVTYTLAHFQLAKENNQFRMDTPLSAVEVGKNRKDIEWASQKKRQTTWPPVYVPPPKVKVRNEKPQGDSSLLSFIRRWTYLMITRLYVQCLVTVFSKVNIGNRKKEQKTEWR